jgi:type IV pilus assembly protein PilC
MKMPMLIFRTSDRKNNINLYSRLETLIGSGFSIYDALDVCKDNPLIPLVKANLEKGISLSQSLQLAGRFASFEISIIEAGERSNDLPGSFKNLLLYHSFRKEILRSLSQILAYPILVLMTALLTIIFMMNFIIPSFQEIFLRTSKEIPAITKFVFAFSGMMEMILGSPVFWALLVVLLVMVRYRKKEIAGFCLNLLLGIPFLKKWMLGLVSLILFGNLAVLIQSGIFLLEALKQSKNLVFIPRIRKRMEKMESSIRLGRSIHEAFEDADFLEREDLALIKAGEQSNQLPEAFSRIAKTHQELLKNETMLFGKILEPVILLIIGGIVGFILVAMYLPMFQMNSIF